MTASNYQTAFPDDSEFLDAEPLHLSEHGALDDFDFILDQDDEDVGDERLFADSRGSSDLDVLLAGAAGSNLASSRGSATMDFQLEAETLQHSLNNMHFDPIGEVVGDDEVMRSSSSSRGSYRPSRGRSRRARSPGPLQSHSRSFNAVNFDPTPVAPADQQFHGHRRQPQRQTSHGDLSMCSYATAQSSMGGGDRRRYSESVINNGPQEQSNYNKALQRLAESMKRTEESRNHVMMQRKMLLTPEQELALSSAKEQLRKQNEQVSQQQQQGVPPPPAPRNNDAQGQEARTSRPLSPGRSSIMTAFFSGSRGTLTSGLEQSRKQLGLYMGQVNQQTL